MNVISTFVMLLECKIAMLIKWTSFTPEGELFTFFNNWMRKVNAFAHALDAPFFLCWRVLTHQEWSDASEEMLTL